jgi:excisionase family DNA binding protein
MEKQILQIETISADEILTRLDKIETLLTGIKASDQKKSPDNEYLTRFEVAELFSITVATVHQWTVNGILSAYRIGRRIYYKRKEIDQTYQKKTSRKRVNS